MGCNGTIVSKVAASVAEGVTVSGVACDVRQLPRIQLALSSGASSSGSSTSSGVVPPLLPGEFEHYDAVVFGGTSHRGDVYVSILPLFEAPTAFFAPILSSS